MSNSVAAGNAHGERRYHLSAEMVDAGVVGVACNSILTLSLPEISQELKNFAAASNAYRAPHYHLSAEVINAVAKGVACGNTRAP